jgi:ribonuclease HII
MNLHFLSEEEKKALMEWIRDDNKVCSWLVATIEPHISELWSYQNSAQAMWEMIRKLFSKKKNYAHIYNL